MTPPKKKPQQHRRHTEQDLGAAEEDLEGLEEDEDDGDGNGNAGLPSRGLGGAAGVGRGGGGVGAGGRGGGGRGMLANGTDDEDFQVRYDLCFFEFGCLSWLLMLVSDNI